MTFSHHREKTALIDENSLYSFADIEAKKNTWLKFLSDNGIRAGAVVGIQSDFSFDSISLLFALFENKNIAALVSPASSNPSELLRDSYTEALISFNEEKVEVHHYDSYENIHPLIQGLNNLGKSGFIVFTSGTSGKPKAVLHDLEKFQASLRDVSKSFRTLAFLLFDHIAGVDTLLYTFKSGGSLVVVNDRSPHAICASIEKNDVEVLPVSPSFINLLYMSKDYEKYDLSSLKIVTLGSEPINSVILKRAQTMFQNAKIIQKYGTSEFGSPRTKTRGDDANWIKMESEFLKIKIVDDILWVKTQTTMLGYLNRKEQPIQDGWYCTGDRVEVNGEWLRILGRESDLINIGGEKVLPLEVESIISELDWVEDCLVYGEPNPILGNIVCATIKTSDDSPHEVILNRVRKHCLSALERYKIPVKIKTTKDTLVSLRQKKIRI